MDTDRNRTDDTNEIDDLTEMIDFLNDDWERLEPTTIEAQALMYEEAQELGAYVQEGGRLRQSLSGGPSRARSMPSFSIC